MSAESPPPRRRASSRCDSFRYAFAGLAYVVRTQQNAWIHGVVSVAVLLLGLALQLTRVELAILLLTIGLVWIAEAVNTSLETIVDLASPEVHPLAKTGKDVAAAAVLIAAMTAVTVGVVILGPPLWNRFLSLM